MARFSWVTLVVVIFGGALGVAVRAVLVVPWGPGVHPLVLPAITMLVNVAGSFLLGLIAGRLGPRRPRLRAFLGTGVLGGFTTYSAFAVQTVQVFGAAPVTGLLLAAVAVLGGVAAAAWGLVIGRRKATVPEEVGG
ncbi:MULTISPECIES: CrcB family protein [unclassified Microbacterium]|uniref:fluoride efflux transporter FluC n=1 Tax=unclassified Microbacterium TaxID=2609290 RepID=UPI00214AF3B2|nr:MULTISPECIES: CrcB family protein [unclassified Microbacterium]MCR2784649.1 CrcB family protein [Microbacterium sp. zg.B96]MDL5353082.1 CrcB family protein [Microbacterium sp. zg-YB36]WIM16191.1 CrcB family protein [Microbacterium sp. zg-B96]